MLSQPKRQKDRVAELEAQVAALTRLLQAQGIDDPSTASAAQQDSSSEGPSPLSSALSNGTASQGGKKRRLENGASDTDATSLSPSSPSGIENDISKLDRILTWALQERVLYRYVNECFPTFPAVPLPPNTTLHSLRCEKPILHLAIMFAASTAVVPLDLQEEIASLALSRMAESAASPGPHSLELLQAIQIVCLWYRSPKQHKQVALNQLICSACNIAEGLGISGPLHGPWMDGRDSGIKAEKDACEEKDEESIDCWRAWMVCYHLAVSGTLFMRRRNVMQQWDDHHEQCALFLFHSPYALPTDRVLSKLLRAERLCEQIAYTLGLTDPDTFIDISEPSTRTKIQTCRNLVLNWKVQTPQSLRTPLLFFWENVALAYMHEPVLHTPTNKETFTAPFVADRLSVTDFPSQAVTEQHITAVYELLSALHCIIDTLCNWSTSELLGQSGLIVSSRATYANYTLLKLYVATVAPGNTLGAVIDPTLLRYEEYSDKLIAAAARISEIDDRCSPSRILGAASKLREWYENYNASLVLDIKLPVQPNEPRFSTSLMPATEPAVVAPELQQVPTDWESILQFGDEYNNLDVLFGDPLMFDQEALNSISGS